jgi:hypothetical protein
MQNRKPCMVLVAVALVTCWAANAQEFAYDNMIGGRVSSPAPLSVPVLAYGGGGSTSNVPTQIFISPT